MTEEQREALRKIFEQQFDSDIEAGLAVAQLLGCAVIPTKEIVWFQPGEPMRCVARLQQSDNGKLQWIEQ